MSIPLPPKHPARTSAQIHRAYAKACSAAGANTSSTSGGLDECRRASPNQDADLFDSDSDRATTPMLPVDDKWSSPFSHARVSSRATSTTPSRGVRNTTDRVDRRFWPRDTRGLLEMCEQGYQLQQGMKSHCKDTAQALEQMAGSCENTVQEMLTQLEETLRVIQIETAKPVNLDWAPILTELNEKISPGICSILEKQEASATRLEDHMLLHMAGIAEKLSGSIENRSEAQKSEMCCLREEIRAAQKGVADCQQFTKSSQELMLNTLREEQMSLQTIVKEAIQELLERMENRQKHLSGIEIENALCNVQANQEQQCREVKEGHDAVHRDVGLLFNEIGVLQKAFHLPFLKPRRGSLFEGCRVREIEAQTDGGEVKDEGTQTEIFLPSAHERRKKKEPEKKKSQSARDRATRRAQDLPKGTSNLLLADDATKKKRMRDQLIKPQYNVANYYYDTGCAQAIAKSHVFENATFFVILFNAVWIAVETDQNDEPLLVDAPLIFQIVENFFCAFFALELLTRFMAFKRNIYCIKDFWFVFDLVLVTGMILETWVLTLVIITSNLKPDAGGVGNLSLLRMVRLVKVCRMARMARLLRSVPELVMIIKGMGVAFRSVSFFMLLAVIILYVFAVALRQFTMDSPVGERHFQTVPRSMGYLLLEGMLPIYAPIINEVSADKPYLWPVMLLFVLLASVTVLNMLIGVLTEVVRTVAAAEKEAMTVVHVTQQLRKVMSEFKFQNVEMGGGVFQRRSTRRMSIIGSLPGWEHTPTGEEDLGNVSKQEFEDFLTKPEVGKILRDCGVDVSGLLDMTDLIYEDQEKATEGLTFADFVDIVLNLRGSNPATVKDIKEMLRIVKNDVSDARHHLHKQLLKEIGDFRVDMAEQLLRINKQDSESEGSNRSAGSKISKISRASRSPHNRRGSSGDDSGPPGAVRFSPINSNCLDDDDDVSELSASD